MKTIRRHPFFWLFFLVLIMAGGIGFGIRVQILAIGEQGPRFRVKEGDLLSLRYTQSMYGVPVEEKLRIENEHFVLFEVASTGAALEYLGIEKQGKDNVHGTIKAFSIPRASVGKHVLVIGSRQVPLPEVPGLEPRITIRLCQQPLFKYLLRIKHE